MLLKEPGWSAVHEVFSSDSITPLLAGPTLTEVITVCRRTGGTSTGAAIWKALEALGARIEPPLAQDLVRAAELIELSRRSHHSGARLSLGDSLILAITERLGCPVVTRDDLWTTLAEQGHLKVKVQQL